MSFSARIIAGNAVVVVVTVVTMTLLSPQNLTHIMISAIVGLMLLAGSSLILWLLCRNAFKPLVSVVEALEKAAGGDLSVRAEVVGTGELARLATAFNKMMTDMNNAMRQFFSVADLVRDSVVMVRGTTEAMASAAEALVRAASGQSDEIAGTVRLTASEVVGAEVLPAMLAAFRNDHPNVSIELNLDNQTVDLVRRDADIAVRMVEPSQKALLARKVGSVSLGLHATRSYLKRYGVPRSLDELTNHALIGFDAIQPPARIIKSLPLRVTRDSFSFRCDSDLGQLAALRAGFGIGACQFGIARRNPELVPVLADQLAFDMELWVVMHENLKKVKRMRLMFDHLAEQLTQYAEDAGRI